MTGAAFLFLLLLGNGESLILDHGLTRQDCQALLAAWERPAAMVGAGVACREGRP